MMQNALASILHAGGAVAEADLAEAQRLVSEGQGALDEILLKKKYLTETALLNARGEQYGLPVAFELPMEGAKIDHLERVPIGFLKKHLIIPLGTASSIAIDHKPGDATDSPPPFLHCHLQSGPIVRGR